MLCLCFRTCLGHNCSVEEKLEFKRSKMFFRKWKSFVIKVIWLVVIVGHRRQWVQELVLRGRGSGGLSGVLVEKQGLSLKQWGKIYQCCVRSVLLYSFNPLLVFGENIGCRCSNECNSSYYWLSTWLITWKYNAVNKSWLVAAKMTKTNLQCFCFYVY